LSKTNTKNSIPLSIAANWRDYEATVLSPDAGSVQRHETRIAFYAGVLAMNAITGHIGEPEVSEEKGMAILSAIETELLAFGEELKRDSVRR
jgi:NAD-specific glutamate dehydrogenase